MTILIFKSSEPFSQDGHNRREECGPSDETRSITSDKALTAALGETTSTTSDDETAVTLSEEASKGKADDPTLPPLLRLPAEIIHHILTFVESQHLVSLSRTCRRLKAAAEQDILWTELLRPHIPEKDFPSQTPYPAPSYRDLYLGHHPYWFLPRNRIWMSDEPHVGRLILCKFDPRRGCIEGYRILAERGPATGLRWSYKPSVVIHHFSPRVHLWLDDPVLSLPYEITPSKLKHHKDGWQGELQMSIGSGNHSTSAAFFLSKTIPTAAQYPGMSVWPPRAIPNMPRVRAESIDKFQGKGHRPTQYEEISQTTFRMRQWSQFTNGLAYFGVRLGEEVNTWSTLDFDLYMPTEDKPYQGIFVGDYAGHGCEFLLVMQTDAAPRPPNEHVPNEYLTLILSAMEDEVTADVVNAYPSGRPGQDVSARPVKPNVQNPNAHRGSLEAIKLTGDPNVPRGEHTFIADDISDAGMIRIAEEYPFRGARVVKSRGHVAARGFQNGEHFSLESVAIVGTNLEDPDQFIPSQLIMISPDRLAQYWIPFGHISFYERVDIDRLLNQTSYRRASG